uniref:Interferon/interleukin receptor domain-containing protein n=1 Tax=Oncorhynchus tshawytscha TaxID=74940 RepID=A0AAZ3RSM8_ONCTS
MLVLWSNYNVVAPSSVLSSYIGFKITIGLMVKSLSMSGCIDAPSRVSDLEKWHNISGCVQTELTTCNIQSGCVMVRVLAQEGNRTSRSVEACRHADSCSPEVQLTSKEGLLMVHMVKNNRLLEDNGDHFEYHVQYGRDGEELKVSRNVETIERLDVGRRYCVQVRYLCYQKPFGTPSVQHCESIPESGEAHPGFLYELKVFFTDHNFHLSDDEFLTRLAYLGEVFSRLNDLNLGLQGLSATIINVRDKIEAVIKNLELFSRSFHHCMIVCCCVQMNSSLRTMSNVI